MKCLEFKQVHGRPDGFHVSVTSTPSGGWNNLQALIMTTDHIGDAADNNTHDDGQDILQFGTHRSPHLFDVVLH